jgi:hypothetical protein
MLTAKYIGRHLLMQLGFARWILTTQAVRLQSMYTVESSENHIIWEAVKMQLQVILISGEEGFCLCKSWKRLIMMLKEQKMVCQKDKIM